MGYESIESTKMISFADFSAGVFPGKEHNEIPGSITDPNTPVGASDADNVIWYEGALRKFFGTSTVTSPSLGASTLVQSLFYSYVLDAFIGNVGTAIYSGLDGATPTARTAALTIANVQMSWAEWQFETNSYVVGVDGTNGPVKWTGSGDATLLGGSPPNGRWVIRWQDCLWIARTSAETSTIYFSNIGDPEVWTTNDDYKFDAPITGVGVLGDKLVVFMEDHIGIMSGTNNRALTKVDRYVSGYGCTGGHTIKAAKLRGQDVLIFHSKEGFCAFDGSQNIIHLSSPIRRKYVNSDSTERFNASRFQYAYAAYVSRYGWYMCGLSDGADTNNDFLVILDLNRVYQDKEGVYVPHWFVDGLRVNSIVSAKTSSNDVTYFGGSTGVVSKFDESLYARAGSSYTGYFVSKTFDNINTWVLNEFNILGDQQSASLAVYMNADLQQGDGTLDTVSFVEEADQLDLTFIMDMSRFAGRDFLYKNADISTFGRFFKFKLSNTSATEQMTILGTSLVFTEIGVDENVDEVTA